MFRNIRAKTFTHVWHKKTIWAIFILPSTVIGLPFSEKFLFWKHSTWLKHDMNDSNQNILILGSSCFKAPSLFWSYYLQNLILHSRDSYPRLLQMPFEPRHMGSEITHLVRTQKKLTFFTPWYAHVCNAHGGKKWYFSEHFANVLNEWSFWQELSPILLILTTPFIALRVTHGPLILEGLSSSGNSRTFTIRSTDFSYCFY